MKTISKPPFNSAPGKQTGLSLIELMIASVIGLVILSGAVSIFSSNSSSSKLSGGMGRVQDSGRVALDILSYSARMTGYDGCRDETKDPAIVLAKEAPDNINLATGAVWGSEVGLGSWDPVVHTDLAVLDTKDLVKPGTDVLYLQHGSGLSLTLAADMPDRSAGIVLTRNPDHLAAGDLVMISDCQNSEIFRVSDIALDQASGQVTVQHGASENVQGSLNGLYSGTGNAEDVPVRVMRFESNAYFVGESGRETPQGDPIYSLFLLDTTGDPIADPVELVEGVENLQVLYGENMQPNGKEPAIAYVTADNVTDPANILSIRLGLLVASADYSAQTPDNRTYNVAGTTIGPASNPLADGEHNGDKRLRAAFNATIQLRNRNL